MSQPPPPSGGGQWGWEGSGPSQGHWPTPQTPPTQPPPPQQPPQQGQPQPAQPQFQYAGGQQYPHGGRPHPSGDQPPNRRRPWLIALVAVLVRVLGVGIGWGMTNLLSQDDTTAVAAPSEAPSAPASASAAPAPSQSAGAEDGGPGSAPAEELPDDPSEALTQISETDEEEVVAELDGKWVPQISSKKAGMEIDGKTWTDEDILADHQALRDEHPRVRLVWSGNFGSFKEGDFWITIAGIGYSDAEQALSWCATNGLGPDDCYAKQLNTGGGHEGTTKLQ